MQSAAATAAAAAVDVAVAWSQAMTLKRSIQIKKKRKTKMKHNIIIIMNTMPCRGAKKNSSFLLKSVCFRLSIAGAVPCPKAKCHARGRHSNSHTHTRIQPAFVSQLIMSACKRSSAQSRRKVFQVRCLSLSIFFWYATSC